MKSLVIFLILITTSHTFALLSNTEIARVLEAVSHDDDSIMAGLRFDPDFSPTPEISEEDQGLIFEALKAGYLDPLNFVHFADLDSNEITPAPINCRPSSRHYDGPIACDPSVGQRTGFTLSGNQTCRFLFQHHTCTADDIRKINSIPRRSPNRPVIRYDGNGRYLYTQRFPDWWF